LQYEALTSFSNARIAGAPAAAAPAFAVLRALLVMLLVKESLCGVPAAWLRAAGSVAGASAGRALPLKSVLLGVVLLLPGPAVPDETALPFLGKGAPVLVWEPAPECFPLLLLLPLLLVCILLQLVQVASLATRA
jgi:hypothetical protein